MRLCAIGTVFVQLILGPNAFITGRGFAKMGMTTVLIGAVANIVLDPIFLFALKLGVQGRGACDGALPRPFLCVGDCLPLRKKNSPASERKQSPEGTESAAAMHCTGYVLLCYAVEREHYHGVLQLLAAALWRGTILPSVMQFALLRTDLGGAQPIASYNFGAGNAGRVKRVFGSCSRRV